MCSLVPSVSSFIKDSFSEFSNSSLLRITVVVPFNTIALSLKSTPGFSPTSYRTLSSDALFLIPVRLSLRLPLVIRHLLLSSSTPLSLFHFRLKTYRFHKSFPRQTSYSTNSCLHALSQYRFFCTYPFQFLVFLFHRFFIFRFRAVKCKDSPYSITECRVPELISVVGSQPAGDVSHTPGGRLPLLSARPAVTPATLKRAATNFAAW